MKGELKRKTILLTSLKLACIEKNQFYFYDAFNILYLYLFCLQKVISYTKSLYNIASKRVFYNLQNCHA